jgi:hypothetical protein
MRRQAFDLPQKDDGPRLEWQGLERPAELRSQVPQGGQRFGRSARVHQRIGQKRSIWRAGVEGRQSRWLVCALPADHQAGIAHCAIEPGAEGARFSQAAHMPVRLQQGLLHGVLGVIRLAAHGHAEAPGHVLCRHQQPFQGLAVAGNRSFDQRRVIRCYFFAIHESLLIWTTTR